MKSIAIDGPAGAGKSSVAKAVAKKLGFLYVDTGALYRAIGLFAARHAFDLAGESVLAYALNQLHLELKYINGEQRVFLDSKDVTDDIRSPRVSQASSVVSAMPAVRLYLFGLQQEMARKYDVVMDGRDIGTVILPNADVKIFLTASVQARAKRRYDEYIAKGETVSYNDILEEVTKRDDADTNRSVSPLKKADDAVLVDCSDCTLEQSIELVMNLLGERGIS